MPVTDAAAFLRIASEPELIQREATYAAQVEADGYRFLFQINEEGWPVDGDPGSEFIEEHLFGFGSLYLYGNLDQPGRADDIVAGFLNL